MPCEWRRKCVQCPTASHFEHIYAHINTLTSEYYFRRMTEIYERVPIAKWRPGNLVERDFRFVRLHKNQPSSYYKIISLVGKSSISSIKWYLLYENPLCMISNDISSRQIIFLILQNDISSRQFLYQ